MNSELQQVVEQLSSLIRAEVGGVRTEVATFKDDVRSELTTFRSEFTTFREEIRSDVGGLRNEVTALRSEVTGLGSEVTGLRGELAERIHETKEQFAALLAAEIGSLHTHLQEAEGRINGKLDAAHARMERQGGMLRSGQIALLRLNDWSETLDRLMADRDKRIESLEDRLRKLEDRNGKN